jgi:hypothetical protein
LPALFLPPHNLAAADKFSALTPAYPRCPAMYTTLAGSSTPAKNAELFTFPPPFTPPHHVLIVRNLLNFKKSMSVLCENIQKSIDLKSMIC